MHRSTLSLEFSAYHGTYEYLAVLHTVYTVLRGVTLGITNLKVLSLHLINVQREVGICCEDFYRVVKVQSISNENGIDPGLVNLSCLNLNHGLASLRFGLRFSALPSSPQFEKGSQLRVNHGSTIKRQAAVGPV